MIQSETGKPVRVEITEATRQDAVHPYPQRFDLACGRRAASANPPAPN
jgi:hypothetical protein